MVRIFFPHRCDKQLANQAKAAANWITEAPECHDMSPSWATCKLLTNLQDKVPDNGPSGPFFHRLQSRLPWWQRNSADPGVLNLITHGVTSSYPLPSSLSVHPCFRNQEETNLAWETIREYLEIGASKEIPLHQARHLIPWFVIKKGENSNCKELNN